jgi:outer membrane protein
MKMQLLIVLISLIISVPVFPQTSETDSIWTFEDCIQYALVQNIQVRKSDLANQSALLNIGSSKAQRLPNLNATVNQSFKWGNQEDISSGETEFTGSNATNYSLNSSVSLFNGLSLNYRIKQAGLDFESSRYNSETIKESISLSILDAFLQVLYTEEQVKNSQKQLESTTEELRLAEERLNLSIISQSDYLQVKSQLASEKLTLANAQSQFAIAKVNLMQLMELPVSNNFIFSHPDMNEVANQDRVPDATSVYSTALDIKPQVKNAEMNKESATYDEKIARASYFPVLSLNAGVGTGYSSVTSNEVYFNQVNDQISPSIGFNLSIPIFQRNQVKTNVSNARIGIQNAELSEIEIKNQLRKEIEQACVDVTSAQIEYEASLEQYQATEESYMLAEEKFGQGLINSVDFLFVKTNLIVAESQLLQSKYNLIFSYKILDFYTGVPLTLED